MPLINPRHINLVKVWSPNVALAGVAGFFATVYFFDWGLFGRYIPYYGSKFPPVEKSKKPVAGAGGGEQEKPKSEHQEKHENEAA